MNFKTLWIVLSFLILFQLSYAETYNFEQVRDNQLLYQQISERFSPESIVQPILRNYTEQILDRTSFAERSNLTVYSDRENDYIRTSNVSITMPTQSEFYTEVKNISNGVKITHTIIAPPTTDLVYQFHIDELVSIDGKINYTEELATLNDGLTQNGWNVTDGTLWKNNVVVPKIQFVDGATFNYRDLENDAKLIFRNITVTSDTVTLTYGFDTINIFPYIIDPTFGATCGETLLDNTTLIADLSCAGGTGLTIGANDITLDCAGWAVAGDNTFGTFGVYSAYNNTVLTNCNISNFWIGLGAVASNNIIFNNSVHDSTIGISINYYNNTISNNIVYNNSVSGIDVNIGVANGGEHNISNNIAYNNGQFGFSFANMNHSIIVNNTAYNNSAGFEFGQSFYNILNDNIAYNNSNYGFLFNSFDSNTLNRNIAHDSWDQSMLSPAGFSFTNSDNNSLNHNIAYGNGTISGGNQLFGFLFDSSNNNNLYSNTAYDNNNDEFYFINSSYNTIESNLAYNSIGPQFSFWDYSDNNIINSNTMYGSPWYGGLYITNSSNNVVSNSASYNNNYFGFWFDDTHNTTVINNSAYNDSLEAFAVQFGQDTYFINNRAYDSNGGISSYSSANTVITNMVFYNNVEFDFAVELGSFSANNMVFLPPSGTIENYTTININDVLTANEAYLISWIVEPSPLSANYTSFNQKFINITNMTVWGYTDPVSIDSISWSWSTGELVGYDETKFELWQYETNWTLIPATLNTNTHTLTVTNFVPGSIYGIWQNNNPVPETTHFQASGQETTEETTVGLTEGAEPTVAEQVAETVNDYIPDLVGTIPPTVDGKDIPSTIIREWQSLLGLYLKLPILDRLNFGYVLILFLILLSSYATSKIPERKTAFSGSVLLIMCILFLFLSIVSMIMSKALLFFAIRGLGG